METAFFLAANSACGFYSLYHEFPGAGSFLHIIKGGPGTGKSGFMKKIAARAEELGMDTELIYCSGDPDSLDALCIPELKAAWMDGTAPHVREPGLFGIDSDYVNLGRFCRLPLACEDEERAKRINREYKLHYAKAYEYLAAEAAVKKAEAERPSPLREEREEFIASLLAELPKAGREPVRRFISAISCRGSVSLDETANKLCKQNYAVSHAELKLAETIAAEKRAYMILCPEALLPDRIQAILLPEPGICLRAEDEHSHISRMLRRRAVEELAAAKALHDELEQVYRPYMDFEALSLYTEEYIEKLFKNIM